MKLLLNFTFEYFLRIVESVLDSPLTSSSSDALSRHHFWAGKYVRIMAILLLLFFRLDLPGSLCINHLLEDSPNMLFIFSAHAPLSFIIKRSNIKRYQRFLLIAVIFDHWGNHMLKMFVNVSIRLCQYHQKAEQIPLADHPLTLRIGQHIADCAC